MDKRAEESFEEHHEPKLDDMQGGPHRSTTKRSAAALVLPIGITMAVLLGLLLLYYKQIICII